MSGRKPRKISIARALSYWNVRALQGLSDTEVEELAKHTQELDLFFRQWNALKKSLDEEFGEKVYGMPTEERKVVAEEEARERAKRMKQ